MKRKTVSVFVIAFALVCFARSALALDPVFSSDLYDYVATLDYDDTANKVGLVLDIQLAQNITLAAIPTLVTTYSTVSPWPTMFPSISWDAVNDGKLAMAVRVFGTNNYTPMKLTCTLLTAATADKGDKIRCTQDDKFDLDILASPPLAFDVFKVWLEHYFIVLASGMDPATHTAITMPMNVSAMVARGAAVASAVEEEEEVVAVEDVCDTSVDPDCDGVIGDADLCPDEWGDGEDGCPVAAVPDEGGTISDGGGCSLIVR